MTLSIYELDDLYQKMTERMGQDLLPAITRANRMGDLDELLESLGMGDLGEAPSDDVDLFASKILVLGQSEVKEQKLKSIVRKKGFDSKRFEFYLEYDRLQHYDFAKLRNTLTYKAVMVGPMPHSTPGKLENSSAIAEMENHPDTYPRVIQLRSANELKITNNSFATGLDELAVAN